MWDAWLDLALGSRCVACAVPGRVLCPACVQALPVTAVRVRPEPEPDALAPAFAAGPYADQLRALLLAHKERRVFALARPLGEVLATVVGAVLRCGTPALLVPVPSTPRTVRQRGHDPVARMTRYACRELERAGVPARSAPLLRRYRSVADQAGLGAADRLANLDGAFAVDTAVQRRLAGRRSALVICDDVITTGATARESQRALAEVGLEVAAIAAVAATRRRRGAG